MADDNRKNTGNCGAVRPQSHLILRVRDGWRLNHDGSTFVAADGQQIDTAEVLPCTVTVEPRFPQLHSADQRSLTKDERDLTRYFNVLLPATAPLAEIQAALRVLPFCEQVDMPPEISLPM